MGFWKIFSSRKHGKKPGLNDLPFGAIGVNEADGSLFIRKKTEAGAESIVEVAGGVPGTGESHFRAHQIDSADDHPPVAEADRNKLVATNADTGEIELIGKDEVGGGDFWKRELVGYSYVPTLSPKTSGDRVSIKVDDYYYEPALKLESKQSSCIRAIVTEVATAIPIYCETSGAYSFGASSSNFRAIYCRTRTNSNETRNICLNTIRLEHEHSASYVESGIGVGIEFSISGNPGTGGSYTEHQGELFLEITNTSSVSNVTSDFVMKLKNLGSALTEVFRITGAGILNVKKGISVDGTAAVADGTYTVGKGASQDGTITVKGGIITAIQEASD